MKLEIGQTWISDTHPHEDFHIYDGTFDSFVLSDMEIYVVNSFEEIPETAKILFWKRTNDQAFYSFIESKKGKNYTSTYPYASYGEVGKQSLLRKIKKYNMRLKMK